MRLSIVASMYGSARYIPEFVARCCAAGKLLVGDDYELVLVNDGSPDNSLEAARGATTEIPNLVVVDLSRNFGHHKAMLTGLAHSCGDRVFLIDCDLEELPEWLLDFNTEMENTGADVVFGVQRVRRGGWFERWSGRAYYRLFRLFTGSDQPDDIVTARLMSRRYVDCLLQYRESEINIGGMWYHAGFHQVPMKVDKLSHGSTTYSLGRKLNHVVTGITSFSSAPLVWTFYLGLLISGGAAIYITYLLFRFFFAQQPPEGYTSVVASIWLLFGVVVVLLGVQGIYLSRVFIEVKHRPLTIVRSVYRRSTKHNNEDSQ
jgi:putative glycosyltransferase